MRDVSQQITQILTADETPAERINKAFHALYPQIRQLANAQLQRLPAGQTITPTVLVHECFLRLMKPEDLPAKNTSHFICAVAKSMRHYLVDVIRQKNRNKSRPANASSGITQVIGDEDINFRVLELDRQLNSLQQIDPNLAELVEWRFFAGLTLAEVARIKELSERQVARQWKIAKSLLLTLGQEQPLTEPATKPETP